MLRGLGRDVKALVEGPQRTARDLVAQAQLARADETRRELLERARSELDRAANQETDALRASHARLLSAALWSGLDSHETEISTRQLLEAHKAAVLAAKDMEDREFTPPRAMRFFLGPLRLAGRAAVGPLELRRRPKSLRMGLTSTAKAPLLGTAKVDQFVATRTAKERERHLAEIHRYACELRELLIQRGVPQDDLPAYRPALREAGKAEYGLFPRATATFWGLVYEEVPSGEPVERCEAEPALSDARNPVAAEFRRRNGQVWESVWKHSGNSISRSRRRKES